jgi:hypothetical protein
MRPISLKDYLQLVHNRKRIVKDIWIGLNLVSSEHRFSYQWRGLGGSVRLVEALG